MTYPNKKLVTLCADDYGQNSAISEGILSLIETDRLSATSCLTNLPNWNDFAKQLLPYRDKIDIGLHFNLTEGKTATNSLGSLMIRSHLRCLSQQAIAQELNSQLDNFENAMGKAPDFIDGHQHIHHLPIVRNALLAVYEQRLIKHRTYLRIVANDHFWQHANNSTSLLKMTLLALTGSRALKQIVTKKMIPHNQSFAGIYDFNSMVDYPAYFAKVLSNIKNHGLIMCHPGLQSADKTDLIKNARWREYQYLSSDQFLQKCILQNVTITRFSKRQIKQQHNT